MVLIFDLVRNKRLLNIPVVISIFSFHLYGIFQSMQYIPMIWSLIFLSLGYAMTTDKMFCRFGFKRVMGILVKVSAVTGDYRFFRLLEQFESRRLAQKYGMKAYAKEQDRDRFFRIFQVSKRWKLWGL